MREVLSFSMGVARLYEPQEAARVVVLLPMEQERTEALLPLLSPGVVLAALDGTDWNRDFSPWPAPAVFGREDFSGGAPTYLAALVEEVIPELRRRWPGLPLVMAGYSLAGLFAVWACAQTDCFDGAASMSGSLWFDGFTDYLRQTPCRAGQVYLSVGDREKRTRNVRMQRVEEACREAQSLLAAQGIGTRFELNQGNHFQQVPERIAKGVNWVAAQLAHT